MKRKVMHSLQIYSQISCRKHYNLLEPRDCQEQIIDHKQTKEETQAYNEVRQDCLRLGTEERDLLMIYTRLQEDLQGSLKGLLNKDSQNWLQLLYL